MFFVFTSSCQISKKKTEERITKTLQDHKKKKTAYGSAFLTKHAKPRKAKSQKRKKTTNISTHICGLHFPLEHAKIHTHFFNFQNPTPFLTLHPNHTSVFAFPNLLNSHFLLIFLVVHYVLWFLQEVHVDMGICTARGMEWRQQL